MTWARETALISVSLAFNQTSTYIHVGSTTTSRDTEMGPVHCVVCLFAPQV